MYIAGIDIGATNLKFGLFKAGGDAPVYTQTLRSVSGDALGMAQKIAKLIREAPYPAEIVGVGAPGAVHMPGGEVYASNLRWHGVRFGEMLAGVLSLPVWVDNDAQVALAAEMLPGGACHGLDTAVYLTLGTGVGGALLIGGAPWRGVNNGAAELGHFITHAGGLKCSCGMCGCFEMYASAGALSRLAGGVRARSVIDRARLGDKKMLMALRTYASEIAVGVCSLNMIFRPQAIVLGGGVSAAGDILLNEIKAAAREAYDMEDGYLNTVLTLATRKNGAGMMGAAELARLHLCADARK